ncbi:MAG: hypothetical protein E6R14_05760 [Thermomicrobiales bacterium]|nr:MAG: hypothetical protein E6R14_05760 [Thermomicrobiales bacterium]
MRHHLCGPLIHLALEGLRTDPGRDGLGDDDLLSIRVSSAQKNRGISDTSLGSFILGNQLLKNPHLTHLRVRALSYEVTCPSSEHSAQHGA